MMKLWRSALQLESTGVEPQEMFKVIYNALIGKEKGPRLANFMLVVGKDRLLEISGLVLDRR